MGFMKPKVPKPSAAEIKAREDQQRRLEEQEKSAKLEADRARELRLSGQRASRAGARGRASLIKTGSELGTKSKLG